MSEIMENPNIKLISEELKRLNDRLDVFSNASNLNEYDKKDYDYWKFERKLLINYITETRIFIPIGRELYE